tara:strand:+ start:269 stop:493 length:225 start_codon:yes stop_codon:yes gene_type:complete
MKLSKNFRKILSSILSNPPSSDKLNLLKKDLFIIEFSNWEKSISILNRYIKNNKDRERSIKEFKSIRDGNPING